MDRLLTIKEVAAILRVSERTIFRYIKSGKIKASKIGHWRISEKNIYKLLNKTNN